MFTGIITHTTDIVSSDKKDGSLFLTFNTPKGFVLKNGDSVSTNGVCLTVSSIKGKTYTTELMEETLKKSSFGLTIPDKVNLEKPMILNARLDGHIVQGHVDSVGKLIKITPHNRSSVLCFRFPKKYARYVAAKGSIAVDGISLTVVDVGDDWFTVSLVDYTLQHTTLGAKKTAEPVNLEFDIIAKYVERMIKG